MNRLWIMMIVSLFLLGPAWTAGAEEADAAEEADVEAGAEPNAADADASVADIRFQFDGMPYEDVVRRFADMAEKPLIKEAEVEGTLTFTDPDPYTYEEAFDAINQILATKEVALIEEGRFLKLVRLEHLERTDTQIFRGLDDTGDVRPGEVVTVVLTLEHLEAADVLEAAQAMLSPAGSVAPMTREQGLIITDRLSSIRRVQRLIAEVDTESAVQRQMKTYNLLTAPGAVLANLINQTFGEATAPQRVRYNRRAEEYQELSPSPEDYITAIFDEPSRTLVLFGPRDRMELAEELIAQFEDETAERAGEVKIFYPSTVTADELARMIREAVPGVGSGRQASGTDARVIVDESIERLIVTAPAATQLEEIERLIYQIDEGAREQGGEDIERMPPDRLKVTRVYELGDDADLETVEQAIAQATTTVGPGDRRRERLQITADSRQNRLIVTGSPGDVEEAEQIVNALEGDDPDEPRHRQVQVVQLEAKQIDEVFDDVQSLVQEAQDSPAFRNVPAPLLLPDASNNRLIVTATAEQFQQIEQIVATVDVKPQRRSRSIHVVDLEHKTADELIPTVNELLDEVADDAPEDGPRPRLMPHAQDRRIIVLATEEDYGEISELIARFDQDEPIEPTEPRQTRTVDLPEEEADELAPLVTELYQEHRQGEREPAGGFATVNTDRSNRRLILTGPEDELERVEGIVRQLTETRQEPARQETRVFRLQHAEANQLQGLLDASLNEQDARPVVRIQVDEPSNSLIISGAAEHLDAAAELVDELDTRRETQPRRLRLIELHEGNAAQLEPLVSNLFEQMMIEEHGANYEPETRIFADAGSNRLAVIGPEDEVARLADLVAELDRGDPREGEPNEVFALEHADATNVAEIVTEALTNYDRRGRPILEASVSADADTNSVIVSGDEEDVRAARTIIERLDVPSRRTERQMQFVEVDEGRAEQVAELAAELWQEQAEDRRDAAQVSIRPDNANDRLIVVAPQQHLEPLQALIESLSQREEPEQRQLHRLTLNHGTHEQWLDTIEELYAEQTGGNPPARLMSGPTARQIFVVGSDEQAERVRHIVATLEEDAPDSRRETRYFAMDSVRELNRVQPLVEDLYEQALQDNPDLGDADAHFLADTQGARLIVTGRPAHLDRIEQILDELHNDDPAPRAERQTRVYDLEATDADDLAETLRQLYQEHAEDRPGVDTDRVLILPDAATNRLVVTAPDSELEQLERLLEDLDRVSDQTGDTRVFQLRRAEASEVAELVSSALSDMQRGRARPRVSVGAHESTNTLVISGSPEDLRAASTVVKQLDDVDEDERRPRMLRTFRVAEESAERIAEQVEQLYREQAKGAEEDEKTDALILPDPSADRLIVTATEGQLEAIETIIEALEPITPEQPRETRMVRLGSAERVQRLTPLAQQLYEAELEDDRDAGPADAQIIADAEDGRIIVTARPDHADRIEAIIERLDERGLEMEDRETRVYELTATTASDFAGTVQQLYEQRAASRPEARTDDLLVLPDAATNRLLVTGVPAELDEVERIIKEVDTVSTQTGDTRLFQLETSEAEQVASLLSQAMLMPDRRGRMRERVAVGADPRSNTVIVSGERDDLQAAAMIIEQLDGVVETRERDLRIFELQSQGKAEEMAEQARELYMDQLKSREDSGVADARIIADADTNRLIVTADVDHLPVLEEVIEKLDESGRETGRQMRVLSVSTSAGSLVAVIDQMLADRVAATPAERLIVSASPDDRAIVASAPRQTLERVEELIDSLDDPEQPHRPEIRSYYVPDAEADLASTLARLFAEDDPAAGGPEPRFEAGPNDQIMVAATEEQFARIEAIMEDLQQPVQISSRVETFELEHADVSEVQQILQQMLGPDTDLSGMPGWMRRRMAQQMQEETPVRVTAAPSINAVMVQGSAGHLALAKELVSNLDVPEREQDRRRVEIRSYRLLEGDVSELAPTLARLFEEEEPDTDVPQPRFEADGASDRLMVAATSEQFERIEQLIEDYRTPAEAESQVQTFELEHADASQIQQVLREMLTDEAELAALSPRQRRRAMQRRQQQAEDVPVRITAARALNAVIVQGSPSQLSLAEHLIDNLDVATEDHRRVEIRTYALPEGDVSELAPTLARLFEEEDRDAAETQPRFEADASTNVVMVAATEDQFERIEQLIEQLQAPAEVTTQIQTFELEHADAAETQQLLQELLTDEAEMAGLSRGWRMRMMQQRQQEGDTPVRVTAARALNAVIVQGPPRQLELAEHLVQSLDVPVEDRRRLEIRAYSAPDGDVEELASRLGRLFEEEAETDRPQPRFEADPAGTTIMVAAMEDQFERIETLIERLQEPAEVTRRVQTFELEHADASQIQQVLLEMLTDEAEMEGLSRGWRMRMMQQRQQEGDTPVRITAARALNAVIVQGSPSQLALAEHLIDNLDVPVEDHRRVEIRSYALPEGDVSELAPTLARLFEEEDRDDAEPQPRFEADASTNLVMVAATEDQFERIEQLIEELQTPAEVTTQIQTFELEHADASQIQQVLREMLTDEAEMAGLSRGWQMRMMQQRRQEGDTPVRITTARALNAVIVQGSPSQLSLAEHLIDNLDVPAEDHHRLEIRSYHFAEGDVSELASTLARLFAEEDRDETEPQPRFEAEPATQRIMVAAPEDHFERIEALVQDLQEPTETATQVRTFALEHADVDQVRQVLQQMLTDEAEMEGLSTGLRWRMMQQRDDDRTPVRITAVRGIRSVIVQAGPTQLALAEQLVENIDVPEGPEDGTIRTVRLEKAEAASLATAVNDAIAARQDQFEGRHVSVTPEPNSNSLLINGPDRAVDEVLEIVRELDEEGDHRGIDVRIFRIENGEAEEISAMLRDMLDGVFRRPGEAEAVTMTVDRRSNSLIISARQAQFVMVEQLLAALDDAPEPMDREIRYVRLKHADAFDVASRVRMLFEDRDADDRPVIEADIFTEAITIIARKADLDPIEDMIAELDEVTRDETVQVRVIPLQEVPAQQMAEMLRDVHGQMTGSHVELVDRLPPPALPDPGVPEEAVDPGALQEVIDLPDGPDPAAPVVAIAHDRDSNTLLMSGPGYELDALENLVSDLQFSFVSSDADFRRFQLDHADPEAVAQTLTELFREEPVEVVLREGDDEERRVQQEQQITIVPEPRTRSVIVRARPTHFEVVESLIQQLDEDGVPAQAEMRLFALEHAAPERLLPIVQDMLDQVTETRPGDVVSVHVDEATRSLVVIGRDHVFEQVAEVVEQFDTDATLTEADVKLVPLTETEASTMAAVLNDMLSPSADGQVTPEARALQEQVRKLNVRGDDGETVSLDLGQPIKVAASDASNFLVLTSTPENLPALAAVARMMDTVPLIDGVDVRLITLERADAATVEQTLEEIFTQGRTLGEGPAGDALPDGESGEALTSPLNIAVDARTNTLILSGHPAALDLAEKLAADLDEEVERFVTEVELFRLRHASAENLEPLLQAVFAESGSDPGAEGLATQVTRLRRVLEDEGEEVMTEQPKTRAALTVQADDVTNTLVIAARSDMMPLIADVIETMDVPDATGMDNIRIVPLDHADAENVVSVIEDLYDGPLASRMPAADRPHITVDPRTNALLIAGNDKAWGIIGGLVQQLDRELPVELRDVRMIPVENADATALASMIQQLLDARVEQRQAMGRAEAESLRVEVIGDSRTNSLLVAGSQEAFGEVESLAERLDREGPDLAGQVDLIELEHATAATLATTLSNLFTQRYAAAQTDDIARRQPIILADTRTNSLMVVATGDDRRAIDDLLDRLDRKPESPAVQMELVALRHNEAQTVAQMLSQVFQSRLQATTRPGEQPEPQEQVAVHPELLTNSVVITASGENIEVARELIEQVDTEPIAEEGAIRTFALEHAEAHRAAATLQSLISQGVYRPGAATGPQQERRERLAVEVNPRANAIIVSASPENMAIVEQVIDRIDNDAHDASADMRVYVLEHASAPRLSTTLASFFQARHASEQAAGEPSMPVSIVADERTNALLVTGGAESFQTIERLIERLDVEEDLELANYRIFPLENTTAAKVKQTLDELFAARPTAPGAPAHQPITVIADPWINAVVVSAATEDMAMVMSLVERLDEAPEDADDNVEIFRLAKADAGQVAETVENLYREAGPGAQDVSLNVDERLNAIVVSAGAADRQRIGSLVRRLDTEDLARVAEIRVIQLEHARADELSQLLTELLTSSPSPPGDAPDAGQRLLQFVARTGGEDQEEIASALQEGVLITPDARTNSLVISAPVESMPLLEHVISRLDASSPQIARIRVFSLDNADAQQMADVLQDLFRLQQAASESERSIRYTLVRPDEEVIPDGDLLDAPATLGTAEQHALTVTVDVRTNSLLVGGTEHYVSLASDLIEELDSSPAQERISRVYRLRNAQAVDIEPAIRDFLDQERQRVTQILGEEGVGTVQRLLDREVAIVAENTSNTLLLSASPRYFNDVATLIEELDEPAAQVLIQVMLAEVTLDDTLDLGTEWRYTPVIDGTPVEAGTDFGVADDLAEFGGFSTVVTGGDFQFLLRALQAEGRLEVLSRPQILAADNQEADIEVGARVPLVTDSRVTERGDTITSFEYEAVGIQLNVTPRISHDGFVNLTVSPSISAISAQTVAVAPGLDVPVIDERRALTQVSVQDGNTIIIGGLISTRDERTEDKVPFFGDLPLVGAAFRSTRTSQERTELLIILTPHVIHNMTDAREMTREHLRDSTIHDMPDDDKLRQRLMEEIGEDGVYKVDPESEDGNDFRPVRHDLYEERAGHELLDDGASDSDDDEEPQPEAEESDESDEPDSN